VGSGRINRSLPAWGVWPPRFGGGPA